MNRVRIPAIALGALALSLSGAAFGAGQGAKHYRPGAAEVARTQKDFGGGAGEFRFVVIGDRTGKHRPGVFEGAMEKVERLRPDFVINIGDLIEGNTEDLAQLDTEWKEVGAAIDRLSVPQHRGSAAAQDRAHAIAPALWCRRDEDRLRRVAGRPRKGGGDLR